MVKIEFQNVTLSYPVYGHHSMSLRSKFFQLATGGRIHQEGQSTMITALHEANFIIKEGDSVGLIGHNGAGKSTLLRLMAGIYPPSIGRVVLKGRIATIFDIGAGIEIELTGYENIVNLGMIMGLSKQEALDLTPDIEAFTELGDFLHMPVRTYSSGMIMRLMFGVSTSISPDILLLDEMFSTGDASFREKSNRRIKGIINKSKIFVFASHDENLLKSYCNRIFKLKNGFIFEE